MVVEIYHRVAVLENPGGSCIFVLCAEEELWLPGQNVWYTTAELIYWILSLIYALNSVETAVHDIGTGSKD